MDELPSRAPGASRPRRPFLVWLTQLFAALLALFVTSVLLSDVLALPGFVAKGIPLWRLFSSLAYHGILLTLLVALFAGLATRRRWAWSGGIIFAALMLVLVVVSRIWPLTGGPLHKLAIAPDERLGAAIAEFTVTALVVVYPLRLFFSRKVRAFFGIPK